MDLQTLRCNKHSSLSLERDRSRTSPTNFEREDAPLGSVRSVETRGRAAVASTLVDSAIYVTRTREAASSSTLRASVPIVDLRRNQGIRLLLAAVIGTAAILFEPISFSEDLAECAIRSR